MFSLPVTSTTIGVKKQFTLAQKEPPTMLPNLGETRYARIIANVPNMQVEIPKNGMKNSHL